MSTKARSEEIQAAAQALLKERGWQPDEQVPYRQLAPTLMQRASCGIDAAKRHLVRAGMLLRGEETAARWGGAREGAGRPAKDDQ